MSNYILLEQANVKSLNRVDVGSVLIIDSAEDEERRVFKNAATVIMTFCVKLW